jgi:hypothetical protein
MIKESAKELVESNFKLLNGKCFYTNDNKLLIAQYIGKEIEDDLQNFIKINDFKVLELK